MWVLENLKVAPAPRQKIKSCQRKCVCERVTCSCQLLLSRCLWRCCSTENSRKQWRLVWSWQRASVHLWRPTRMLWTRGSVCTTCNISEVRGRLNASIGPSFEQKFTWTRTTQIILFHFVYMWRTLTRLIASYRVLRTSFCSESSSIMQLWVCFVTSLIVKFEFPHQKRQSAFLRSDTNRSKRLVFDNKAKRFDY